MFVLLAASILVAGSLGAFPGSSNAVATSEIDQSFTAPSNLGSAINECCRFVAQTFTAGRTGLLTGVNVNVEGFRTTLLHVAIRTVAAGVPTGTVLGETTLDSNSAPLTRLITFPQMIEVTAGLQYAIVVNYDGAPPPGPGQAQGGWGGATGDAYPPGALLVSFEDGLSWFGEQGFDVHFQTYVATTPSCNGKPATIVGPAGDSTVAGTAGPDVIVDLSGNNKIRAAGGGDTICTGPGNDAINGGGGDDWVDAGDGRNSAEGNAGHDRLITGSGSDELEGNGGNDTLTGGTGADRFRGGDGTDTATDFTPAEGDTKTSVEVF